MTNEEIIERHKQLHKSLDELLACFILTTKKSLMETNLLELMQWSHAAAHNLTVCFSHKEGRSQQNIGVGDVVRVNLINIGPWTAKVVKVDGDKITTTFDYTDESDPWKTKAYEQEHHVSNVELISKGKEGPL